MTHDPGRWGKDSPYSEQERAQVAQLHAEGHGRNEIARRTGIHSRRVSRIAESLGLSFRRSNVTKAATEARKEDARARRAALAVKLLEDAERLRQQLWSPAKAFNFGGKENTYNETTLPEPTFADKRNIMMAIGAAVDRAVKLDEYDSGAGLGQVVSLLDQLGKGLAAKYGTGDDEHPIEPDGGPP